MKITLIKIGVCTVIALVGTFGRADLVTQGPVKCTATKVTPEGARFFGFSKPVVAGDTTSIDLAANEIEGITFASGAHIGSTGTKHPIIKEKVDFNEMSIFQAEFVSHINQQHYLARLIASEYDKAQPISITLDVLENETQGRLVLNSLELSCTR